MTLSVAQIAALAVGGVQGTIPDAVHSATLTRATQGAYSTATASYAIGTPIVQTGRAVVATGTPIADVFPAYVVGPSDQLVFLEGFTSCMENDLLAYAGRTLIVRQTQDIAAAGSVFYAVAR